jgi:hypothetical protein
MACKWVTADDLAIALRLPRRTIIRWGKEGRLEMIQPGGKGGTLRFCAQGLSKKDRPAGVPERGPNA